MKKLITFLLVGLLVLPMAGCIKGPKDSEVPFYYRRAEFDYGTPDGIIAQELHDVSGRTDDLKYLLALYLQGPSDQELILPFPDGTILVDFSEESQSVSVTLSSSATRLDDMDLTIACVCLAETCFAISDAQQVHIQSLVSVAGKSVDTTITRGSILLPGYKILPKDTE